MQGQSCHNSPVERPFCLIDQDDLQKGQELSGICQKDIIKKVVKSKMSGMCQRNVVIEDKGYC